jgi:hypothetical protein
VKKRKTRALRMLVEQELGGAILERLKIMTAQEDPD